MDVTLKDTGLWEIWIDNLDGNLAMRKTQMAKRKIEVVELEVFDRALEQRDQAYKVALDRKAQIHKLRRERDEYKRLAESWMNDYDKIKEKYEPTEAVLSEF